MKLSCKEASRLLSQREDRELSPSEQVVLKAHLAICSACRVAGEQVQQLRRALRGLFDRDP